VYDPLAVASRVAMAVSILLTFPLPFVGLRDGLFDAMNVPDADRTDTTVVSVTVALLLMITVLALLIQDLSLVLAVGGATFSTAVSSVFPTLMLRSMTVIKNPQTPPPPNDTATSSSLDHARVQPNFPTNSFEPNLALALMIFNIAIGLAGLTISLSRA
jgi:Transmembrane amino acid transporter protein